MSLREYELALLLFLDWMV